VLLHDGRTRRAVHVLLIYLVENGYSTTTVGVLWTLGVVAEIVVFVALPALFRRFSLRAILIASFAAAAVRFVAIGWGVESLALLALAQLLHGLTFGAYHAAAIAAVHRMFGGALAVRGQALARRLTDWAESPMVPAGRGYWAGNFRDRSSAFGLAGAVLIASRPGSTAPWERTRRSRPCHTQSSA
jgi:hypothetical protein